MSIKIFQGGSSILALICFITLCYNILFVLLVLLISCAPIRTWYVLRQVAVLRDPKYQRNKPLEDLWHIIIFNEQYGVVKDWCIPSQLSLFPVFSNASFSMLQSSQIP